MTFDDFRTFYAGKPIDWDKYYGYQCVDLLCQYTNDCLGYPQAAPGNAIDRWNNFNQTQYFDKIMNTPTGVPLKGDIVFWSASVGGGAGHVAVFVSGNVNAFVSFDQNWPTGSYCHEQPHNYAYVLGWLHPKAPTQSVPDYKALYEADERKLNQIKAIIG